MSSRTWWKSSSRDFMPSRYTEIRKAAVRAATAGPQVAARRRRLAHRGPGQTGSGGSRPAVRLLD